MTKKKGELCYTLKVSSWLSTDSILLKWWNYKFFGKWLLKIIGRQIAVRYRGIYYTCNTPFTMINGSWFDDYLPYQHDLFTFYFNKFNCQLILLFLIFVFSFSLFLSLDFLAVDNADMLLEKSQKMIERFSYPWEMMPLLYVILKYANGDLEEATNQLSEGNQTQIIYVDEIFLFFSAKFSIITSREIITINFYVFVKTIYIAIKHFFFFGFNKCTILFGLNINYSSNSIIRLFFFLDSFRTRFHW